MAFTIEDAKKSYADSLKVTNGEYELIVTKVDVALTKADPSTGKTSREYVRVTYTIRPDVEQAHKGATASSFAFIDDIARLSKLALDVGTAAGLDPFTDYGSAVGLLKACLNKPLRATLNTTEKGGFTNTFADRFSTPLVGMASVVKPANNVPASTTKKNAAPVAATPTPAVVKEDALLLDEDDLPF